MVDRVRKIISTVFFVAILLLVTTKQSAFASYSYKSLYFSPSTGSITYSGLTSQEGGTINIMLDSGEEVFTSVEFDIIYPSTVAYFYNASDNIAKNVSYTNAYSCSASAINSSAGLDNRSTHIVCGTTDTSSATKYTGIIATVTFVSEVQNGQATFYLDNSGAGQISTLGTATYRLGSSVISGTPTPLNPEEGDPNGKGGADIEKLPQTSLFSDITTMIGFLLIFGGIGWKLYLSNHKKDNGELKLTFVEKL